MKRCLFELVHVNFIAIHILILDTLHLGSIILPLLISQLGIPFHFVHFRLIIGHILTLKGLYFSPSQRELEHGLHKLIHIDAVINIRLPHRDNIILHTVIDQLRLPELHNSQPNPIDNLVPLTEYTLKYPTEHFFGEEAAEVRYVPGCGVEEGIYHLLFADSVHVLQVLLEQFRVDVVLHLDRLRAFVVPG
jgi:hypothetical protein